MAGEEEVNGKKTVEGLRGRLLAERAASRAAREEADLLSKRLSELESLLAMEIKARDRAEKILRFILGKLKSTLPSENKAKEKSDLLPWEYLGDGASLDATSEICSTSRSNDREESWSSFGNSSPSTMDENLQLESRPSGNHCNGEITEEIRRDEQTASSPSTLDANLQLESRSNRSNCNGEITEEIKRKQAASFPEARRGRRVASVSAMIPVLSTEGSFNLAGAMAR